MENRCEPNEKYKFNKHQYLSTIKSRKKLYMKNLQIYKGPKSHLCPK